MFKERIVQFSDGTYGIQVSRGSWFNEPKFLWLKYSNCTSGVSCEYFMGHCRSNNLPLVEEILSCRQNPNPLLTFTPV